MQAILKSRAGICPREFFIGAGRRLFGALVFVELLFIALLFTSRNGLAAAATIDVSPLVSKSTLVAPVDGNQQISVLLALPSSDPAGLAGFVHHVSAPGDPLYRQYLTPEQFAQKFGGNADDYAYLKTWATASGLQVAQEAVSRVNLVVRGSVARLENLFKTQLNTYQAPDGQTFYSASMPPTVPAEIASKVSGVIGLTSGKPLAPMVKVAKTLGENPLVRSDKIRTDTAGGTGPGGTYNAKDLRTAYTIPTFGNLSKSTVVAIFEQGGYKVSDTDVYFQKNNLPRVKQTPVAVDESPIKVEYAIELEACLDIDTVVGINPDVAEVRVYIDDYNNDPFNVAMPAAITAVANDNKASILSISYAQDEGWQGNNAMNAENTALQQCAAEGITVLAASGDDGAFGASGVLYYVPYNVCDPASQPYVTGVGGTTLFTGADEAFIEEQVWNDLLGAGGGATGGGISSYWSIPTYQTPSEFPLYTTLNGGSSTMRNVPDVAAVGDPLTGVGIYVKDEGGWVQVGGTSLSCPLWAGYLSTINAAFSYAGIGNLGFINPVLYDLGAELQVTGADWFNDVYEGSNGYDVPNSTLPGYANAQGYSNTTGAGSMWGNGLASQLLVSQSRPGTPPRNFWFNTPIVKRTSFEINWVVSNGANAYVMGLYNQDSGTFEAFVTKETKLKVDGLIPNATYYLYGWSINASGAFETITLFQMPK